MILPPNIPTLEAFATGNFTRPDNVYLTEEATDLVTSCNTHPESRPSKTDHFPIHTTLSLSTPSALFRPRRNFRMTDWEKFQSTLARHLPPAPNIIPDIATFRNHITALYDALSLSIAEHVPLQRPCPYSKRWWNPTLAKLVKEKHRLGRMAFQTRHDPTDPVHEASRTSRNKFSNEADKARVGLWDNFLGEAIDIWIISHLISAPPTDGAKSRIPDLKSTDANGNPVVVSNNADKATTLLDHFFPPRNPDLLPIDPTAHTYPDPAFSVQPITALQIQCAIDRLSPYKATADNEISNAVFKCCSDLLIPHLLPLFQASLTLRYYPPEWRNSSTIVLRKPAKPDYQQPKAYRPIELLCSMGKILSAVIANTIITESELHNLLPRNQFGCRPGRTTTDSLHYVVHWIKNAWRRGNVVSALFLDIKGAFPSVLIDRLVHNMRLRRIPQGYTEWIEQKGQPRTTTISFDDYKSPPLPIESGLPQGCPLSPLCFIFYNADLDSIPRRNKGEEALEFVDDVKLLAEGKTFREANRKILRMVNHHTKGILQWAHTHNCEFEVSKSALVGFSHRREQDPDNPNTTRLILPDPIAIQGTPVPVVAEHKFLGVILDSTLSFKSHSALAIKRGAAFIATFRRLARTTKGIASKHFRRFFISIAVPRIFYAASVWLTPPSSDFRQSRGILRRLSSIQRQAALLATGALPSTASDSLNAHADLLPLPLLASRIAFRESVRMISLPPTHPLHHPIRRSTRLLKRHNSPLHRLLHIFHLSPTAFESIPAVRHPSSWSSNIKTSIPHSREAAIALSRQLHSPVTIYTDGSGIDGHIGAAAELYLNSATHIQARFQLGLTTQHTVFEGELTGILMAINMLPSLPDALNLSNVIIRSDSQAAIRSTRLTKPTSASYLIDLIHDALAHASTIHRHLSIELHWIPGHEGIPENESIDLQAKRAARGDTSNPSYVPERLLATGRLPISKSAAIQHHSANLKAEHKTLLTSSPRFLRLTEIDRTTPSNRFRKLVDKLPRRQASLLIQLRTGHISLNKHLHRIGKSETPQCPACHERTETVMHFLLQCPAHSAHRTTLYSNLRYRSRSISHLLSSPKALPHLFKYISDTGRLSSTFTTLV
jgi:ribonuclease HI